MVNKEVFEKYLNGEKITEIEKQELFDDVLKDSENIPGLGLDFDIVAEDIMVSHFPSKHMSQFFSIKEDPSHQIENISVIDLQGFLGSFFKICKQHYRYKKAMEKVLSYYVKVSKEMRKKLIKNGKIPKITPEILKEAEQILKEKELRGEFDFW